MPENFVKILLRIREYIVYYIKRYETPILVALKFIAGLIIFTHINSINQVEAGLLKMIKFQNTTLLFALVFTVLPLILSYGLIIISICIQFSAHTEICALLLLVMVCFMFFYLRLAKRESVLVLVTVFACFFKLPYLAAFIAGMYFLPTALIPVGIGIVFWQFMYLPFMLAENVKTVGLSFMDMPDSFTQILSMSKEALMNNHEWTFTVFLFAMIIIVVNMISKFSINHSRYIALGLGAAIGFIGLIAGSAALGLDNNIANGFISILFSGLIMCIVLFFDLLLDYSRAERVRIEDDDNYYYVKIIPKVITVQKLKQRNTAKKPNSGITSKPDISNDEKPYSYTDTFGESDASQDEYEYTGSSYYEKDEFGTADDSLVYSTDKPLGFTKKLSNGNSSSKLSMDTIISAKPLIDTSEEDDENIEVTNID